jgi:hypothetical protein
MDADAGFTYLGRIDTQPGEEYFYSTWTRGVFMDGTVHAVNAEAVRSADLLDIEHTIGRLDLD